MDTTIILERNPWLRNREEIKNDEQVIYALSRKHSISYSFTDETSKIFIGPRRSGKTTYFKLLIYDLLLRKKVDPKDVIFVSCEILKDYADLIDIFRMLPSKYVFLDEITFVDGWEKAIKYAIDQGMLKGRIVYITGSSVAFLKKETFPGRNISFEPFNPMSFLSFARAFGSDALREEINSKKQGIERFMHYYSDITRLFMSYMGCGGFHRPAFQLMEDGVIQQENYDDIYSWFRGDMLKLGRSEEIARAIIARLLETITTPVAYHSIGNYIGVSHRIVHDYIEEMKNLMYLNFCYHIDRSKKIPIFRKEKKIYFADPFIAHMFEKKIIGRDIIDAPRMAEMILFNSLKLGGKDVYVLNDGKETDFWVEGNLFEVKWSENPKPREGVTILCRKGYDQKARVLPLPVFLLHYLRKHERSSLRISRTPGR